MAFTDEMDDLNSKPDETGETSKPDEIDETGNGETGETGATGEGGMIGGIADNRDGPAKSWDDPKSWVLFAKGLFSYFIITMLVGLFGSKSIDFNSPL